MVSKSGERISQKQRILISQRYKRVTRAINVEFWGTDSDTAHTLYVGSYGRGTAVDTSDIDILAELPRSEYNRFDSHKSNGQSRLLQAVRLAILNTYPKSNVRADGQVVVIDFFDGMKFEILPAFKQVDWLGNPNGKYDYPDTNIGGKWQSTNPKAEQDAMATKNKDSNGLLYDTCKHIREIRDNHFRSYHLSGIVIDSFVYNHIDDWHWLKEGETPTQPRGTYEKKLLNDCPTSNLILVAPGSEDLVNTASSLDCLRKVLNYMSKE